MTTARTHYFVQLLLKEFPRGLRKKDVAQFLAVDVDDVESVLRSMLDENVVEYSRTNGCWRLLRHSLVSERHWKKEFLTRPKPFQNIYQFPKQHLLQLCILQQKVFMLKSHHQKQVFLKKSRMNIPL